MDVVGVVVMLVWFDGKLLLVVMFNFDVKVVYQVQGDFDVRFGDEFIDYFDLYGFFMCYQGCGYQ